MRSCWNLISEKKMLPLAHIDNFILQRYLFRTKFWLWMLVHVITFSHKNHVGINNKVHKHSLFLHLLKLLLVITKYCLFLISFPISQVFFHCFSNYHFLLKMHINQNSFKSPNYILQIDLPPTSAVWKCVMHNLSKYKFIHLFNKYLLNNCMYVWETCYAWKNQG